MSTYVISDIHGCFREFKKMLRKVDFRFGIDTLIIAGDLTDRGEQNYEMLKWMEEERANVFYIMGNHDYDLCRDLKLFSQVLKTSEINGDIDKFIDCYKKVRKYNKDKYGTIRRLIIENHATVEEFDLWISRIKSFDYYKELNIGDKTYIICHAGYLDTSAYSDPDFLARRYGYAHEFVFNIWARDDMLDVGGRRGATIVFGHTPTIIKNSRYYNNGKVFQYYNESLDCRFLNIDCGYVYHKIDKTANMAIIRLEDEKIFYLKRIHEKLY